MALAASTRAIELISNSKNPKLDIIQAVGNLTKTRILLNRILIATYIRPQKTMGGIIRPDTNVAEDEWQGKVGLVMKLGPDAFADDENNDFKGQKVEIGEWCVYMVGDAKSLNVNGYPCRIVRDSSIQMVVEDPNMVF